MDKMKNNTQSFWWKEGFHDNPIEDGMEITQEYWQELLDGQSMGKIITSDENGYPILIDPPGPSEEELQQTEIARLKAYLVATDWICTKCYEQEVSVKGKYPDIYEKRIAARTRINELEQIE